MNDEKKYHISNNSISPSKYAYFSWLLLLASWMQGIAVLHITLLICLLLSLPHISQSLSKLKDIPWLWIPVVCYELIRIISAAISNNPMSSVIEISDDFRAITFGLLALVFLQNKHDLKIAGWVTFGGFTFLAYWTLGYHLFTHDFSLQSTTDIVLGTLGSVNYAAAITTIAMLSMLTAAILLPWKSARWMLLGIIPLIVLQIPLGSRTTIVVTVVLLISLIFFLRAWKASLVIISLTLIIIGSLALSPSGLTQFSSISSKGEEQIKGHSGLPSIQIRWEIFQVLFHLSMQRPLGLGPGNHKAVDLNSEREFLKHHAKTTCKYMYGFTTDSKAFETFNFNQPQGPGSYPFTQDPHSQYTSIIVETGLLGVIAFLFIIAGITRYTIPLIKKVQPIQYRLLGLSGMLMLAVFMLSGLTVVLIYQAGNLMMFAYIAALSSYKKSAGKNLR